MAKSNHFDALRIFFAVLVIFAHSYNLHPATHHDDPLGRITDGRLSLGALAVNGFFGIGGFLITASFMRSKGWLDFLTRRAKRIYPAFIVATLAMVGVAYLFKIAPASQYRPVADTGKLVAGLALLQGFDPPGVFAHNPGAGVFNGSLWTIRPEFMCYVIVGLVLMFAGVRRRLLSLAIVLGSMAALDVLLKARHDAISPYLWVLVPSPLQEKYIRFFSYFAAGTLAQLNVHRLPRRADLAALAAAVSVVTMIFLPTWWIWLGPIAFTYVVLWCAFLPGGEQTGKVVRRVGDLSYGIYLYGCPIQQLVISWYGDRWTPLQIFAASLPLVTACAMASWWFVERPFLRSRRREVRNDAADSAADTRTAPTNESAGVLSVGRVEMAS